VNPIPCIRPHDQAHQVGAGPRIARGRPHLGYSSTRTAAHASDAIANRYRIDWFGKSLNRGPAIRNSKTTDPLRAGCSMTGSGGAYRGFHPNAMIGVAAAATVRARPMTAPTTKRTLLSDRMFDLITLASNERRRRSSG
jgi:hypothetical protein